MTRFALTRLFLRAAYEDSFFPRYYDSTSVKTPSYRSEIAVKSAS